MAYLAPPMQGISLYQCFSNFVTPRNSKQDSIFSQSPLTRKYITPKCYVCIGRVSKQILQNLFIICILKKSAEPIGGLKETKGFPVPHLRNTYLNSLLKGFKLFQFFFRFKFLKKFLSQSLKYVNKFHFLSSSCGPVRVVGYRI